MTRSPAHLAAVAATLLSTVFGCTVVESEALDDEVTADTAAAPDTAEPLDTAAAPDAAEPVDTAALPDTELQDTAEALDTAEPLDVLTPEDAADTADTGGDACQTVMLSGDLHQYVDEPRWYLLEGGATDLGFGGAAPDQLYVEFYTTSAGTFDLASAVNSDYRTCEQCVLVFQDANTEEEAHLFQRAGTMLVAGTPGGADLTVTLTGVGLEEVAFDAETVSSTPVAGGACYALDGPVSLATPSCFDDAQNGDETGLNCGGATCDPCGAGAGCVGPGDCASGVCTGSLCQTPSCSDAVQNGDETGLNCGGATCDPCGTGAGCVGAGDCASGVCSGDVCQAPSCEDEVQNGEETGLDCGGPDCPECPDACGDACEVWEACNETTAQCEDVPCVLDEVTLGNCVLQ